MQAGFRPVCSSWFTYAAVIYDVDPNDDARTREIIIAHNVPTGLREFVDLIKTYYGDGHTSAFSTNSPLDKHSTRWGLLPMVCHFTPLGQSAPSIAMTMLRIFFAFMLTVYVTVLHKGRDHTPTARPG